MSLDGKPGYRETEAGWIPSEWKASKLGEHVIKVGSGITPKGGSESYLSSGVPLIRSQNVLWGKFSLKEVAHISNDQHERMANSALQPLDVLLNITGASIGRCAVLPVGFGEGNVNQHVCIIRPTDSLNSMFLSYCLNSPFGQGQISKLQAGGNREGLNFQQIRGFTVALPSLPEQQKIASILTAVDDKLDVIARQIAATQSLKQGLMQTLFSRGVGTQDATGRWQAHTEFKDSEFGEIPIGWECRPIGSIAKIVNGNAFKSNLFNDTGIPIIRISNIKPDFTVRIESSVCYEEDLKLKRFMVMSGDVLIAMSGATTGKVGRYYGEEFCYLNQRVGRFDVDPQHASSDFLFHFLRESTTQTLLLATAAGGAQPNISSGNIESIRLRVPPLNEQTKIAEILNALDSKLECFKSKEMHYKNLKRGLMQKLLTGEWRVKLDSAASAA
ncbi:MAG: restriction endonuclease subunit S [Pseudomonas sp.]|uniref:restriction endonuclease subunit S n=1 Tax=Pseudomonas sp. TaxID=306 RepID=UPI002732D41F|nr:restriction endonuclease subunit S [Pseudomonas sp.]MDP3847641.1 restriction endonuclease subunit S [Pseudomonas sp.]